jgi:hypothetical protein
MGKRGFGKGKSPRAQKPFGELGNSGTSPHMMAPQVDGQMLHAQDVTTRSAVFIFSMVWASIFYFVFHKYMVHLEDINCNCAMKDWKHTYIKSYFMIISCLNIVVGVLALGGFLDSMMHNGIGLELMSLTILYGLVSSGIIFMYLQEVKGCNECPCSEHVYREVLTFVNYGQVFTLVQSIVVFIVAMVILPIFVTVMNQKK